MSSQGLLWVDGEDSGPILADVRAHLFSQIDEGIQCPCCDQFAKRYRRRMSSTQAASLVWIVGKFRRENRWINVPLEAPRQFIRAGGYYSLLRWWGVIESRHNDDRSKRNSGDWRPTTKGVSFATGGIRVATHIVTYNNIAEESGGDVMDIHEALRSGNFDYEELMRGEL